MSHTKILCQFSYSNTAFRITVRHGGLYTLLNSVWSFRLTHMLGVTIHMLGVTKFRFDRTHDSKFYNQPDAIN